MLIGFDGFELTAGERVGVGRLALEVLLHLQKLDRQNEYRIYVPQVGLNERLQNSVNLRSANEHWRYRLVRHTRLWSQLTLPFYLYWDKPRPGVFLTPSHYLPRFCPCPAVNFVFDLSYLHFPQMFKPLALYKLKNWTAYSVKKAARVITISQASKLDIIKYYKVEPEKMVVVYPGVNKLKTTAKMANLREQYGVTGEYILYVGTLQPRKNVVRLIEAFKLLITNYELPITNKLQLVVVGKKGWMYEDIFARVQELGFDREVVFTGYVPDEDLPAFYQGARCLVLVSLYEGFGLPVVEAMAYGTPVVVSDVSSLPEVAGEVGIYVNPEDTKSIAGGLLKILQLSQSEYKQLSERCKKQAEKFSWEKTARETLELLREVARK